MRNTLNELPVLACCLWAGAFAGGMAFVLGLPKKLRFKMRRGRRRGFFTALLLTLLDIIRVAAVFAVFAAALVYADGGVIRLYAVCGFFGAFAAASKLLGMLP